MEQELEQQVYQAIVQRMVAAHQSHQLVNEHTTSLLLPEVYEDTVEYRNTVAQIMNNHTTVDDETLVQALALQAASSQPPPNNATLFYIRSWTISPNTLRQILALWVENDAEYPETDACMYFATHFREQPLFMRYVGKVSGRPPIARHEQDIAAAGGVLGSFLNALHQVDPGAFENTNIYEFHRARAIGSPMEIDALERIAIAFFGVDSLLNVQHGGYYNAYDPGQQAYSTFAQQYRIRFFNDFHLHAALPTPHSNLIWQNQLAPWMNQIQQEAVRLNSEMPQQLLDVIARQALPRLINGYTILILIGCDITLSGYHHCHAFFDVSRAGNLTKDFLCRQEAWSRGQQIFDSRTFDTSPFPFINVYPWLNQVNTRDAALFQVQTYMNAARPVVTVTFKRMTTSMAFANFLHFYGIMDQRHDSYTDLVGIPVLCHFLDNNWVSSDNDVIPPERATIVVPHIDPGFERYGAFSHQLNKLIDLTWTITLIISEIAVHLARRLSFPRSRAAVVRQVWQACNPATPDNLNPRLANAYAQLREIKGGFDDFRRERQRQQPAVVQDAANVALHEAAITRMGRYGMAEYPPGSPARERQVNELWKKNFPALFIHIDRSHEAEWRLWASTRQTGVHWFASAMRYVGMQHHHPLRNAFNQHRPQGFAPDDDTWLDSEELLSGAVTRWANAMKQHLPPDHFSPENQRRRRQDALINQNRGEYEFTLQVEGRTIYVPATSPAKLRWQDGNTRRALSLHFPGHIVESNQKEHRIFRVRFLAEGVGLDSMNGEPLLHQGSTVIVSLLRLRAEGDGPTLWRLWREERRQLGQDVEEPAIDPEVFPAERRRPAFTSTTSPASQHEFARIPLSETDSLGLLYTFLDQYFYDGGYINLVAPHLIDHFHHISQPIQPLLDEFLQHHQEHPFYPQWVLWNNDIPRNGRHYFANIQYLRQDAVKDPHNGVRFVTPDGAPHRATLIRFGRLGLQQ